MAKKYLHRFQLTYKDVPQDERIDIKLKIPDEIDFINSINKKELSFSFVSDSDDNLKLIWKFVSETIAFNPNEEVTWGDWGDWGGVLSVLAVDETPLEAWDMHRIVPTSINFGELDYSSSSELTIEMTIKYDEVKYRSLISLPLA